MVAQEYRWYLMGKFLTDKPINHQVMQNMLAANSLETGEGDVFQRP